MKVFTIAFSTPDNLNPETVETIDVIMDLQRQYVEDQLRIMGVKFVAHSSIQLDMTPEDEEEEGL
jgi:hypothetical protein